MSLLGTGLTLMAGPTVPVPVPPLLMEALQDVEVTHSDTGRSGFRISFQAGRSGAKDILDYPLLSNPLLKPCNRVIMFVTFGGVPRMLMDGIITNQQLSPGDAPGTALLTVIGEDVSVAMDMEEKTVEHVAQNEYIIASKIILSYAQYGLVPVVRPPPSLDNPTPVTRIPVQQCTDLQYLRQIAGRYGYVFYVTPGPAPMANRAYWGPPDFFAMPQHALTLNMGHASNVSSVSFQYNALEPVRLEGKIQDRQTNQSIPVQGFASTRPPLSSQPALFAQSLVRKNIYRAGEGLDVIQAYARVQGMVDEASNVITADGELDALRYGDVLQARGIVGLRGAGYSYDGLYYVKSVTHSIKKGEYTQRFSLVREGTGAIAPVVVP